jgi:hypothetical protein
VFGGESLDHRVAGRSSVVLVLQSVSAERSAIGRQFVVACSGAASSVDVHVEKQSQSLDRDMEVSLRLRHLPADHSMPSPCEHQPLLAELAHCLSPP